MARPRKLTSREAFNRIFWDDRLDRAAFVIGYGDRVADRPREKPLATWDAEGDIPWNRVLYIRCGSMVVWSRTSPDLLASEDLPPTAWRTPPEAKAPPLPVPVPDVVSCPVFREDTAGWQPVETVPVANPATRLRVLTWN